MNAEKKMPLGIGKSEENVALDIGFADCQYNNHLWCQNLKSLPWSLVIVRRRSASHKGTA